MNILRQFDKRQGRGRCLAPVQYRQADGARDGGGERARHVAWGRHLRQRTLGHQAHTIAPAHRFKGA